jgi:hypothetical protein
VDPLAAAVIWVAPLSRRLTLLDSPYEVSTECAFPKHCRRNALRVIGLAISGEIHAHDPNVVA